MIKLKRETWYYIYTNGEDLFISDDSPIRDKKEWRHPELPLKITRQLFYTPGLKSSEDIIKFETVKFDKPSIAPISFQ